MKKVVYVLMVCFCFMLINCEGMNTEDCLKSVQSKYGEKVFPIRNFTFIVKDKNGKIHFIETGHFIDTEISKDIIVHFE